MSETRLYLVTYDISSPKRWRRVFKALKRIGERKQLSVFMVQSSATRAQRLKAQLDSLIDPETDKIMIIDLGPSATASARIEGEKPPVISALII